jgi:hypothetical protein
MILISIHEYAAAPRASDHQHHAAGTAASTEQTPII